MAPMTRWSPSSVTPLQLLDPAEVDDLLGGVEPHPQDGQQALARPPSPWRRRRPPASAASASADGGGGDVVERCGDHWPAPFVEALGVAASVLVGRALRRSAAGPSPVVASACCRSPADWMACQTRSGVHGIWMSLTPSGRSASTMALTTAGVEAMRPASPTPLAPRCWSSTGETVLSVVKLMQVRGGRAACSRRTSPSRACPARRRPPPPTAPARRPGRCRRAPAPRR